MGGPASLIIDSTATVSEIQDILLRVETRLSAIEAKYSRYRDDSLIATVNRHSGEPTVTPIDQETDVLLSLCDQLWKESGGLFDPTSGIFGKAWDFRSGGALNPALIPALKELAGWQKVERSSAGIRLPEAGMALDLGGIVKEFAADAACSELRLVGIRSALVELAGDIAVIGDQGNGRSWPVGITDPDNPQAGLLTLQLSGGAVATSGNYARSIELNGEVYSHLINPRTGWPVEGPKSVSVIGDNCITAGAIATVACLKEPSDAVIWLNNAGLPWLMIDQHGELSGPIAQARAATVSEVEHCSSKTSSHT